ncbi:MAG TPA: CmpA/NrtA family ABC transporter substrate-binding protein [Burkholderiaceae bacterium]|nr:CmpA/NrtA family ABC transporter substrate-binding protein [Burkholderiaceae bacterium]
MSQHLKGAGRRRALARLTTLAAASALGLPAALAQTSQKKARPEKESLKFGFIKLTDCAPVLIAKEKGFFEDEGLFVTVEAQANWKVLLDRVISGELDGAHMLPGQAIGATIGFGTQAEIVAPIAMGLNTLAVTVSNDIWTQMKKNVPQANGKPAHPIKAEALKPVVDKYKTEGKKFNMGMVFPTSTHNYALRYWLAAGGIHPGYYSPTDITGQISADVLISVTPPPQMPATLESGTIYGYSVGEPWNQQAVFKGIGVPVVTAYHIWNRTPEKVFGMRKDFVEKNPRTAVAITKALLRACMWLDAENGKNRQEAARIFSKREYIGADYDVIVGPITGVYTYEKGDTRPLPQFNIYFKDTASYPYYSDAVWYLTQMRRWGQIADAKPDAWYLDTAKKVYRPDVYMEAAKELIAEGKAKEGDFPKTDGFGAGQSGFIDGVTFDAKKPNEYLNKFKIGLKGNQKG